MSGPTCAVDSTLFGSFKPDSLKVALNYTARRQADVIVTWDYLCKNFFGYDIYSYLWLASLHLVTFFVLCVAERTPSGETAFEISHHTSDGKRGTVCFCLPNVCSESYIVHHLYV